MTSLKWKLVLIYVALVFIVMVISGTFIVMQITGDETERLRNELSRHAGMVYGEVIAQNPPSFFQEGLGRISVSSLYSADIQSNILDGNGVTIASNALQGETFPQYDNAAVIAAIAGSEKFDRGRWPDLNGVMRDWLNYASPCEKEGKKYIIYIQTDISLVMQKAEGTTLTILLASVIALVFATVIGFVFADTITKPIITLTKKAKEMARGKLDVAAPVKSGDEIGQLTRNFNFMAAELNSTMSAITSEKNKLETLLHNMTDGVLAFDARGNVIHANAASKEMLGLAAGELTLAEIERLFDVRVDTESMLESGEPLSASTAVAKKYIAASFAPYTDVSGRAEGIVAVLQDLTAQKALDDMRKEFVANVSHEIRTPLTTIKSYAETLLGGALDDKHAAGGFLQTIDREADRMALLVTDLLQLSSLDNKKLVMKLEDVDIVALAEVNVEHVKVLADNKKQRIVYRKPADSLTVTADKDRATQVITNILSNAVKYSPENTEIRVEIQETKGFAAVSIEDDGIGIPPEDLRRIFERFYRVDKARSRSMGGTGLGLAIAKELIEAMHGYILAESAPGEGTRMTVYFRTVGR